MKKKSLILATVGIAVITAAAVHAQTTPSTAPAVAATPSTAAPASPAAEAVAFSARKKKQLDSISEHIASMQKRQSCIQAAQDEKALGACSHVVPSEAAHAADTPKSSATTVPATTPATTPAVTPAAVAAPALTTTPATPVKP